MKPEKFKHKIIEKVKFHEVDMLGVCNNAVYFNYFEDARIKYVQDLVKSYKMKELLQDESFFIMVHNDCDYLEPAFLDDELYIHTRVSFIKNSSFGFEHLVVKRSGNNIIAKGCGTVVHINKNTKQSLPLPHEFYEAVKNYEGKVEVLK